MTGTDTRNKRPAPAPKKTPEGRGARREHSPASYKLLKILVILLGVLLVWGLLSWLVSAIPLKKVQVQGLTRYGEEEILTCCGLSGTDKLFDVDADAVKQTLTETYPYIEQVRLRYAFPFGYRLEIREVEPVYYTCIAGDYFILSGELMVLERVSTANRCKEMMLQQISLGEAKTVMLGQTLEYGGEYLEQVLAEIDRSILADRVTGVHIANPYHLRVVCDDRYTLYLGDLNAIDAKLKLASLMLQQTDIPEGQRATLDVSDLKKTSIRYDGVEDGLLSTAE